MEITPDLLRRHGACSKQLATFCKLWPDGGEVTLERCLQAVQAGLDFDWAARRLLPAPALTAYDAAIAQARAAYDAARAQALTAYDEATATALAAYDAAIAQALAAYNAARAQALTAYDAARAQALAAYNAAIATALAAYEEAAATAFFEATKLQAATAAGGNDGK